MNYLGELPPGIQILNDIILKGVKAEESNRGNFTNYVFTIGVLNIKVRPYQSNRSYLSIQNQSTSITGNLYVNFNTAAKVGQSIKIIPGGYLEFDTVVPVDAINMVAEQEGIKVVITDGTPPPVGSN